MDDVMTCGCIIACQVHGHPVFDPFLLIKGEPCEVGCFTWKLSFLLCNFCIMIGDTCTQCPRSGMCQESHVYSCIHTQHFILFIDLNDPEFCKMISGSG